MSRIFSGRPGAQGKPVSGGSPLSPISSDGSIGIFTEGVDVGNIRNDPDLGESRRYRVRETMYSERMCSAARAEESGRAASSRFPRLTNAFALRAV